MKKKIKIVHIISNMNDGGAQKIILNYLNDFKEDNKLECSLIVLENNFNPIYKKALNNLNIKVYALNDSNYTKRKSIKKILENNKKLLDLINAINPDIIHIHLFGTLFTCIYLFNKYKKTIFYTLHSSPYRFKGVKRQLARTLLGKKNVISICVTHEQVKQAKKQYKIKKYEVVHNGIDLSKFNSMNISKNEARKKFNLPIDKFIIGSVGRFDPVKKYDFLIEVFKKILIKNGKALMVFVGEGNEKQKIKDIVAQYNIGDSVIFLGNIDNVEEFYCALDVFAFPSESESSGLALLEAQACNVKCVISKGIPNESIITNKVIKINSNYIENDWVDSIIASNNYEKPLYKLEDYDVHEKSKQMKMIYYKYLREKY